MINQEQLYDIAIYEEAILLTDFTGKAPASFIVPEEELMKLFKFNRKVSFTTFPGLIAMSGDLEGTCTYLVTIPRKKRKIIYADAGKFKHLTIEVPNILVEARVSNEQLRIKSLYAYKATLNEQSNLYSLALPNMSGGGMCQGGEVCKTDKGILPAIEKAIFETPFNNHSISVGKENILFHDYLKKYKGKMPFRTLSFNRRAKTILGDYK